MLKSISYSEYEGDPRYWQLRKCDFSQINLIVGKNSVGKSRLINVISGLCRILNGEQKTSFDSGAYEVEVEIDKKLYSYNIEFRLKSVVSESLSIDGELRLERRADGAGKIFYEKMQGFIEFQVPADVVAIQHRQDKLQHSFVVELSDWARRCQEYKFGTKFGADEVLSLSSMEKIDEGSNRKVQGASLLRSYTKAFSRYGSDFDLAIIADMRLLGYNLVEVGTDDVRSIASGIRIAEPLVGIFVKEEAREAPLSQFQMSQGMFRALAMIIHMNVAVRDGVGLTILVDDIGEGLDYERSVALIDLLILRAKESRLQLILTTNDRFVMNRVPLEHWVILRRKASLVTGYSERNSPEEYERFKFIGLSNFDFFTSDVFE